MMKPKTTDSLCIIGHDANFKGVISSGGTIDIEGHFDGNLHSDTVNIRKNAAVTGQFTSSLIRIQGKVENSEIKCTKIIVESNAIIANTIINYTSLIVEHGAILAVTLNHINLSENKEK